MKTGFSGTRKYVIFNNCGNIVRINAHQAHKITEYKRESLTFLQYLYRIHGNHEQKNSYSLSPGKSQPIP